MLSCPDGPVLALELASHLAARASPANDLHHNCELCWLVTMVDDLQPPTAVLLLKQAFSAGKQLWQKRAAE